MEEPVLKLENYLGRCLDFNKVKYPLSASDVESFSLKDILDMADEECKLLWDNMSLGYTESEGDPLLRKEFAKLLNVEQENVMVAVPQEAIYCSIQVLARKMKSSYGSFKAIVTAPMFQALAENFKQLGVETISWDINYNQAKGWHFKIEDLQKILTDDVKVLVINFPHNPTGATLSEGEQPELIKICREKKIFIFSDEIYAFTENDGSSHSPSISSLYEDSISLFGMSKTLALPGIRLGCISCRNKDVFDSICRIKDFTTQCPARPCELIALIAMRSFSTIIKRTMGIVSENIALWREFIERHSGVFEWVAPKAGLVSVIRMCGPLRQQWSATQFCDEALERRGILLIKGSMFGIQEDEQIRIGFARRGMKRGIEELDAFLRELDLSRN